MLPDLVHRFAAPAGPGSGVVDTPRGAIDPRLKPVSLSAQSLDLHTSPEKGGRERKERRHLRGDQSLPPRIGRRAGC